MLRGVDDVGGDPEHAAVHVRRAARQRDERGARAGQPVRHLVDRAVAAEGDHDVVALERGVAAQLGRVPLALRVDGLDLVAALERVDDELLEPHGHRRRVRVDDDQHPPGRHRAPERRGIGQPLERGRLGGGNHHKWDTSLLPALRERPASAAAAMRQDARGDRRHHRPGRGDGRRRGARGRRRHRAAGRLRGGRVPGHQRRRRGARRAAGPPRRAGRADALGRHGLDRGPRPAVGHALQRPRGARHGGRRVGDRRAARRAARAAARGAGAHAGTRAGATPAPRPGGRSGSPTSRAPRC